MLVSFAKYEGIGNDFVVVDDEAALAAIGREQAMAICDRHLGVGADGVLLVDLSGDRPSMRVLNADGSTPEMCGNGLRCVALHLAMCRELGTEFTVDTDAGPHRCRMLEKGREGLVEVDMAVPSLAPEAVPLDAHKPMVDAKLDVNGVSLQITAVSMGNPHAVSFDDVGDRRLTLGPALESHSRFPEGANAGFAQLTDAGGLRLHVFERGVGWTRACGTGACAAAVAAVETGRSPRGTPLQVELPGGTLSIRVGAPEQRVKMTGPARRVFGGEIELADR